ncbi:MAG: SDR family oxidoreductase [Deltaproteobacteria bacterium]|nr:SDR family oxidoreductase [Deltaproteobacteria bacterium]MBW2447408.1 SDR family oxidoreductase [Deltaproteobacteria bacterium]
MSAGRLSGKTALVTGTAQGVGRALALKLAAEGANVFANDLDAEGLEGLEAEVAQAGGSCTGFPGDITGEDFGDRAVEACVSHFGDLDIVVNNAGYIWNSRIVNHTDEQWYAMMDVHATAPFRLLRAAGRHFREQDKAGRTDATRKVVNVSSISGLFGADTQFSYSAAKSALFGMTRSLAKDWGRYNVTVNCVAFGFIETRLTQAFEGEIPAIEVKGQKHRVGIPAAAVEIMKNQTPLGRIGTPADAAGAVFLFCLPESDFITGEIVVASGGLRN